MPIGSGRGPTVQTMAVGALTQRLLRGMDFVIHFFFFHKNVLQHKELHNESAFYGVARSKV